MKKIRTVIRSPNLWYENWIYGLSVKAIFQIFSAAISVVLFISTYSNLPGLHVFGYDEVHYYRDFSFKLIEDGRWLNHILDGVLRSVPLSVWSLLLLALMWLLFFVLAISATQDFLYSMIISSTISISYPMVEQSLWPATTLPAVIILLFIEILIRKRVAPFKIYALGGALLFGTMQNFYFLMPLFFLRSSKEEDRSFWAQSRLTLRHLIFWVAGSVVGVAVMYFFVFVSTGHLGVVPAPWRQTMPAHDPAELFRNLKYVTNVFCDQSDYLFKVSTKNNIYFCLLIAVLILAKIRDIFKRPYVFVILASVYISFFLFLVPLAPVIQSRSLIALVAAAVLFIAFYCKPNEIKQNLAIIVLLIMSFNYCKLGSEYLNQYKRRSDFFYEKVQSLIPGYPGGYSALALTGSINRSYPEAEVFNSPPEMRAIFYALGAHDYWDCRQGVEKRCDDLQPGPVLSSVPFPGGVLTFSINADKVGIVSYISSMKDAD